MKKPKITLRAIRDTLLIIVLTLIIGSYAIGIYQIYKIKHKIEQMANELDQIPAFEY